LIPGQVYASLSSAWAPDSRTIAFGSGQDASPGIRILSVDPNVPPRLLPGTEKVGNVLSFSPDGRWILASWIDGPATSLWRVEVDGDTRERLVGGPFDGDWQWLPANDSGASSAP
jgi:WD40 repeat protein